MWYTIYFVGLLISTVLMAVVATHAWRHREVRGAVSFAWLVTFINGWLWFQLMMQVSPQIEMARFWHKAYFTCIIAVAATWFLFACAYTEQKWLTPPILVLLCLIPFISVLLVWTDDVHHLFIKQLAFHRVGFLLFPERVYGWWFYYVHTLYSYTTIIIGVILLASQAVRSFRLYRLQAAALLIGSVAPLVFNIIVTLGWTQVPITFIGFIITSLAYGWAFFRYRLLELAPIARDTLIERMADGLLVLDVQNRVVDLNPAMRSILCLQPGYTTGQVLETALQCRPDLLQALSGADGLPAEIAVEQGDGTRYYSLTTSPLHDRRGRQSGRLIVAHDVTDLKRANVELDAFAHTVAHSLRSPLFALVRLGKSLQKARGVSDKESQNVRTIVQVSAQLVNIVEELLLLAQVRKKEQIDIQQLDMAPLVDRALERLAYETRLSPADVVMPGAWPVALGYAPWVVEVWVNYISNALKYGGTPPHVELGATAQDGQVRFWARDNGRGLEPEEIARLFVQFEQLGQTNVDGHGLGLSIVRRIVERLGGQVGVESQVGQGSTFWFTLPSCAEPAGGTPS